MVEVRRGDIVIVELNPTKGSEQQGEARPCVVIQNDVGNKFSPTTIVTPFTTQYDPTDTYPFEVEISAEDTPLKQDSVANFSQIRTIDISARVQSNVGSVPESKIPEIDRAIRESLDL